MTRDPAIAIQDIPENLVVALAPRMIAYAPWQAASADALTALAEPHGANVGGCSHPAAPRSIQPVSVSPRAG
ncbi:MAG: hypothetical protein AB1482_03675 [Pseudomonadota bacterium]